MDDIQLGLPFPGVDGFLGTRGSLMLDAVFLAMFAVLPLMGWSIYLVKYRRNYQLHKRIQLMLGVVLLIAVTAFEIDMQLVTSWEQRAEPSPYFDSDHKWTGVVGISLIIHLLFAVPTFLLWIWVIARALRRFDRRPMPNPHSASHRLWAKLAALGMLMTALTGWTFYTLAFVI